MKKKISALFILLFSLSCIVGAMGCGEREVQKVDFTGAGSTIVRQPPESGTPMDYTGLENVSFMAYRLMTEDAYSVVLKSAVKTKVVISYTQSVECYKDYKDGVMLVSDISKSSLVNTARQTCFVNGHAMWRNPESNSPSDWDGKNTQWAQTTPANYAYEDYKQIYGLPSTEFSVYVLNEETLTRWDEVKDNGDGTYSQTIYPDCDSASIYYSVRMMNMGGLARIPNFNSIAITYTFTADWQVLKCETKENYGIKKGMIKSDNCSASTTEIYSYDRDKVDISDYEEFFKEHANSENTNVVPPVKELTAVDYLSGAFGAILTGPSQLSAKVNLDESEIDAKVYVDINNKDIRADLGFLKVYYKDGVIYASINGINVTTSMDGLKEVLSKYTLPTINQEALIEELCLGEFTPTESGATLSTQLTLADTKLPLKFVFNKDEEDNVSLECAQLDNLQLLGKTISATLKFDEGDFIADITTEEIASCADLTDCIKTVSDLADDKIFGIKGNISAEANGTPMNFAVDGDVSLVDGVSLYAGVTGDVSGVGFDAQISYKNGLLRICCGNFGVEVIVTDVAQLETKIDEALTAVNELLGMQFELPAVQMPDLSTALKQVLGMLTVYNEDGEGYKWLDVKYGESVLVKVGSGEIVLQVNTASVNADLTVSAGDGVRDVADIHYINEDELNNLYAYARDIKEITNRDKWNVTYSMVVKNESAEYAQFDNVQYNVSGNLQVVRATDTAPMALSVVLKIISPDTTKKSYVISLTLLNNEVYIKASYYEDETNANYNPLLLKCNVNTVSSIFTTLENVLGLNLPSVEVKSTLLQTVGAILANRGVKANDYIKNISLDNDKLSLTLNGNAIYNADIADIVLSLGKGETDTYSVDIDGLSYKTSPRAWIDLDFTLLNEDFEVVQPTENYIDATTADALVNSLVDSFSALTDGKVNLLDNYCFAGKVSAVIGSYHLDFNVAVNLDIKNLTLTATIGADRKALINKGKYLTYITIDLKNGLIYMMRDEYSHSLFGGDKFSKTTYRSMTMAEFGNDYWSQIVYMTNMGDVVSGVIKSAIKNYKDDAKYLYDVGSYLKSYTFDENANSFKLVLNGTNFSGALGDLSLTLNRNDKAKITNIVGEVQVGITLSLNLDYENVTKESDGTYTLTVSDLKQLWQKEGNTIEMKTGVTSSTENIDDILTYNAV